jgi:AcrR family transcriptional regulator
MKDKDRAEKGNSNVRQRILDAAAILLAEKGFDRTSVRDITKQACCNVASINYYFGGKDNLYLEVYRQRLTLLREVRIEGINNVMSQPDRKVTVEELIRGFAEAFFKPLTDKKNGKTLMQLMWREMVEPHLPERMFLEEVVNPVTKTLTDAMKKVCPKLGDREILLSIESIVAQLVHVIMLQKFQTAHRPSDVPIPEISDYIDHIVEFSAAGIRNFSEKGAGNVTK